MAKKVAPPAQNPVPGADPSQDLTVLHPEQSATIAGRKVVVREYGFVEGLRLRPLTQPIMDALYVVVADQGTPPELDEIMGILADHDEALITLMAIATDVDESWVMGLSQDDGYALMMIWWIVNGPFFIRRVFNRKVARLATERLRAGQTSTTP